MDRSINTQVKCSIIISHLQIFISLSNSFRLSSMQYLTVFFFLLFLDNQFSSKSTKYVSISPLPCKVSLPYTNFLCICVGLFQLTSHSQSLLFYSKSSQPSLLCYAMLSLFIQLDIILRISIKFHVFTHKVTTYILLDLIISKYLLFYKWYFIIKFSKYELMVI